jgi:hypothetical protein
MGREALAADISRRQVLFSPRKVLQRCNERLYGANTEGMGSRETVVMRVGMDVLVMRDTKLSKFRSSSHCIWCTIHESVALMYLPLPLSTRLILCDRIINAPARLQQRIKAASVRPRLL